jgi:hypothetical protein
MCQQVAINRLVRKHTRPGVADKILDYTRLRHPHVVQVRHTVKSCA